MAIMSRFKEDKEIARLPLPTFAYKELEPFKSSELAREDENIDYIRMQEAAKTEEERRKNLEERLAKRKGAK